MNRLLLLSLLSLGYQTASAQLVTESFGTGANAFTMDFVTIGNPNNTADTTGSPNPAGSVAYTYNLAKYEVSREQVDKANSAGSLGITMADMSSYGGNGVNKPASGISYYEAATYVNWLNTSTGGTAAYKFDESGNFQLWSAGDAGYNASNMFRNSLAKYVIASRDEWYKAAYSNLDGTWNNYPTGSDSAPTAVASGTAANTAVLYNGLSGPADIDNAGGLSPWGTMGQGGNVWEWMETAYDGSNNTAGETRDLRGGSWFSFGGFTLGASYRGGDGPADGIDDYGFRVASAFTVLPTITAPYSNLLNNPDSVAQDFNDYSQAISEMMHYESGNYSVSSNRLEFTTASSWLGVKTLKTQLGLSSGWSVEVDFHLSPLNNVINGHWYDTGISLSMGNDLFSAFPNRLNLKAVQSGEGRRIAASFYSDNTERRGLENTTALATATDGTLRMVYNPNDKTINCLFRLSGDTVFTSLGIIDLDQSPGWSVSPTSVFNISLFAGSVPFQAVPSFPTIQSGDMYLTNLKVTPSANYLFWASSYGLLGNNALQSADSDNDGSNNAYEFAFYGNPLTPGCRSVSATVTTGGIKYVWFQIKDINQVSYIAKTSNDLTTAFNAWSTVQSVTSNPQPVGIDSNYEQVEVILPTTSEKGFLKVQADIK